jgi:hypothetical protein
VNGSRYLLALENGEPADPAAFVTDDHEWRPGDTFVVGGQLFKILTVEAEMEADGSPDRMGLLVVEPVGEPLASLVAPSPSAIVSRFFSPEAVPRSDLA